MSGDRLPMRQDDHTQGPEMVLEKSWTAVKVYTLGERCRFPIHSMQDPGRCRRGTVCPGIYGMDRRDREHKGDTSGRGWESPAGSNGKSKEFQVADGNERYGCSYRAGDSAAADTK